MDELTNAQSVVVRLHVLQAADLKGQDSLSKSDPYLNVTLGEEKQTTKERYISDSNTPYFGEVFEFKGNLPGATKLKIDVMDNDASYQPGAL